MWILIHIIVILNILNGQDYLYFDHFTYTYLLIFDNWNHLDYYHTHS